MVRSSHRLALPVLDPADFVQAVEALVRSTSAGCPRAAGEKSLYLRPFMFATEAFLGVRPSQHVTFMVIASPAGAYFSKGPQPITLWLTDRLHPRRPRRHGRGEDGRQLRVSSLVAQQEATAHGCDQVVFLDAPGAQVRRGARRHEHVLRVRRRPHRHPRALGTILEGITRSSIIELAGKMGHQVEERRISIDEWRDGVTSGEIIEVFACGTAAVVTPVGALKWDGGQTPEVAEAGEVTMAIRQALVDIQYGRADDTFGWMHRIV